MTHNYSRLFYHFIWATWDRTPLLVGTVEETAYAVIWSQCAEMGVKVAAIGGIENHVHLLVSLPATLTVAEFVKSVKGISSRTLNQTYGRPAWSFKWQGRYGVHTVGPSQVSLIRHYVENQKQHHTDGTLWSSSEKIEEAD
jgi:putative transposase